MTSLLIFLPKKPYSLNILYIFIIMNDCLQAVSIMFIEIGLGGGEFSHGPGNCSKYHKPEGYV
jgi:hypothetical protein